MVDLRRAESGWTGSESTRLFQTLVDGKTLQDGAPGMRTAAASAGAPVLSTTLDASAASTTTRGSRRGGVDGMPRECPARRLVAIRRWG